MSHLLFIGIIGVVGLNVAFVTYRAWAGGMFNTGLERSKPLEDESWCSPDNDEFRPRR